ncbi:hypothetical protein G4B88_006852 [Cannabis sativa]|uniref:Uncharacterized protein n=1 Tax=Cannabis sativa TaxID=3483 RepID=A0A7J6EMP6_CANSA|nr:hypothetical protein G4B88_000437 [Cannabis sativa]KAF4377572.1 hypothetical protein G4B88_006852 [Cannabis sativa]
MVSLVLNKKKKRSEDSSKVSKPHWCPRTDPPSKPLQPLEEQTQRSTGIEDRLRIKSSVLFWYFLISLKATVPGLKRCGFFTPPVAGADFLAALVASCFLGAFPPVDFLAVCLVRAIENQIYRIEREMKLFVSREN